VFALPVVDRYFGLETEGLGVVLLEAAAAGTPSVTGRSGGTAEAVVDRRSGFVIDARDPTQLIGAIERVLGDPETAQAMGRTGREHVRVHYSSTEPPTALLRWLDG
jgi:phosphatidylinositol alpha-1,6-mannosyltransferase